MNGVHSLVLSTGCVAGVEVLELASSYAPVHCYFSHAHHALLPCGPDKKTTVTQLEGGQESVSERVRIIKKEREREREREREQERM